MRLSILFPADHLRENITPIIIGSLTWGVFTNMIISYITVYFLVPNFFLKKRFTQFITYLLLLFVIATAFGLTLTLINRPLNNSISSAAKPLSYIPIRAAVIRILGNPPLICLLLLSLKKIKDWYIKQNENRVLIRENSNAELLLLKARVHPHFLFNTLNNIYFFILSEPVKAKNLVAKLENLLYYMINECNVPLVPLAKEITMINDYFELEKVRYDNIDIELKILGDDTNKMIAPLLMIPFIENSFKHGTSKMLREPWIKLFLQIDTDMLYFTLTNNKPADAVATKETGIGLNNVKKRLALLHPKDHYLAIKPTPNSFTVNMQIPLV
jgi:two-component system LytT family sensor kinase